MRFENQCFDTFVHDCLRWSGCRLRSSSPRPARTATGEPRPLPKLPRRTTHLPPAGAEYTLSRRFQGSVQRLRALGCWRNPAPQSRVSERKTDGIREDVVSNSILLYPTLSIRHTCMRKLRPNQSESYDQIFAKIMTGAEDGIQWIHFHFTITHTPRSRRCGTSYNLPRTPAG